jgi:hypothetical protein
LYELSVLIIPALLPHLGLPELLAWLVYSFLWRFSEWWIKLLLAVEATRVVRDRGRLRRCERHPDHDSDP